MLLLALDLGSTAFKAAVFDSALTVAGEGSAPLVYDLAPGGVVEFGVDHAAACIRAAVGDALAAGGIAADRLAAVAVTSQAQTFAVCGADGAMRTPFVSWRDTRPGPDNRLAEALLDIAEHSSVAACVPMLLAAKLAFLADGQAGFVGAGDLVLHLPTWWVRRLSGEAVIDPNLAAMSGLYSLKQADWWDKALMACRLTRRNLPRLAPMGAVVAQTNAGARAFGLPAGLPIVLAGNDQTSGAYGAGLHVSGSLLITLGTAQVAYRCLPALPAPAAGTIRGPYPGGRFYQLADDACGGSTVRWAMSVLEGCETGEAFTAAARTGLGDGGLRFVADGDAGSGHWEGTATGAETAARAAALLECLAERMAKAIGRMGVEPADQPVLVAGGGCACAPWVELLAAKLGVELQPADATPARGAARMARECLR